jgi:hypothetical protein
MNKNVTNEEKHVVDLIKSMDNCEREEIASLSNRLAESIMGWHIADGDPERVWRNPSGEVVRMFIGQYPKGHPWAQGVVVCAHPWIHGVNSDDQISFSPVLNYHSKLIDWREILINKINSGI